MPEQKETTQKPIKKVKYNDITKKSLMEKLKGKFPKKLIPTKNFGKIFIFIFVIIFTIAALNFPVSSLMSGNMDATISAGYPLPFLELKLSGNESSPFILANFLIDLIIYLIIAYALNIFLNLILQNDIFKKKEELKGNPVVFKNKTIQKEAPQTVPTSQ
jgi:hypothetical protein